MASNSQKLNMQALITDGSESLVVREVPRPLPSPSELLVRTRAVSLNRGELRMVGMKTGVIPGWDVAGVVDEPALDGSGPQKGERVVALSPHGGTWAQYVAVPSAATAVLPDSIPDAIASTLPTAGLTALHGISIGGMLVGHRVLVTGAAGGVGRFAVQLAAASGAYVTALVRNADRAVGLRELGAQDIAYDINSTAGDYDLIIDGIGGSMLASLLERVAPDGDVFSFGNSSGEPTTFDPRIFFNSAHGACLHTYLVFSELERRSLVGDLTRLVSLVCNGVLVPHIALRADWQEAQIALAELTSRKVNGKAVLVFG